MRRVPVALLSPWALALLVVAARFPAPGSAVLRWHISGRCSDRCTLRASASTGGNYEKKVAAAIAEFGQNPEAPFALLGLSGSPETATKEEVREAFRRLARSEHPDVSAKANSNERFRRLSLAYDILIDDRARMEMVDAMKARAREKAEMEVTQKELQAAKETMTEVFAFSFIFVGMLLFSFLAVSWNNSFMPYSY